MRKLKWWVRPITYLIIFIITYLMLSLLFKRLDNMYKYCDDYYNKTCTYYDAYKLKNRGE